MKRVQVDANAGANAVQLQSKCSDFADAKRPLRAPVRDTRSQIPENSYSGSSLRSEPGAGRRVEKSDEPTAAHVHQAIRTIARPPDGGRSHSVAKRWLKTREPWRIIAAIEGMRTLVDRGTFRDWTPPIMPGEGFSLRAMNGAHTLVDHHSGERVERNVYELATEASLTDPPRQRTRTQGDPMKRLFTEHREAS